MSKSYAQVSGPAAAAELMRETFKRKEHGQRIKLKYKSIMKLNAICRMGTDISDLCCATGCCDSLSVVGGVVALLRSVWREEDTLT